MLQAITNWWWLLFARAELYQGERSLGTWVLWEALGNTRNARIPHAGPKSFYTGQCPEWGHPLDEALIVRWIGLHFFFSFELSHLKAPRKPCLDVARWPARKPLAVRSFIVQNGGAWS